MRIGITGLPGSGKTTCFRVLSGQHPADTHHGVAIASVPIPDPRLDKIAQSENPKKVSYADVTFVDFEGQHAVDRRLASEVDALALVIQCFGDLDCRGEPLDPVADFETILLEMALSDLKVVEGAIDRLNKGPKADRKPQVMDLLQRCRDHLSAGGSLRHLEMGAEDARYLRGFAPLTMMPLLVVCNVAEDDLRGGRARCVGEQAEDLGLPHIEFCAELEEEIAELSVEDQEAFLADYGLEASARDRFLRACFEILDLITFFTTNNNEARAWTLPRGTHAPQAAGRVHSDLEHGFIRAEVTSFKHFEQVGSMHDCKAQGYTRVEGKDYVVQDGDILQIRFSR